ncbi:MAG: histidine phosphatase family protein [Enterococcus sp.]
MLYVTRHGETTWNAQSKVTGIANPPLTEKGRQQAATLAKKVANLEEPITKIIYSPLQRARDTAHAVATYNNLPMTPDERLKEMDFGEFDGMDSRDAVFQQARLEFAVRFPNGESVMDMYRRIVPVLEECLADEENTYLLVCHNALIRVINAYFHPMTNETFFQFYVENTELIGYE